jgi:hypothetical protein
MFLFLLLGWLLLCSLLSRNIIVELHSNFLSYEICFCLTGINLVLLIWLLWSFQLLSRTHRQIHAAGHIHYV